MHIFNRFIEVRLPVVGFGIFVAMLYWVGFYVGASKSLPAPVATPLALPIDAPQRSERDQMIDAQGMIGDDRIKRISELLIPQWEREPKRAAPQNHFELRRPLHRVRRDFSFLHMIRSEKTIGVFERGLAIFEKNLSEHDAGALGITTEAYQSVKRETALLHANGDAIARAIRASKPAPDVITA